MAKRKIINTDSLKEGLLEVGRIMVIASIPLLVVLLEEFNSMLVDGSFTWERLGIVSLIFVTSTFIGVCKGYDRYKHVEYKVSGVDKKGVIPF